MKRVHSSRQLFHLFCNMVNSDLEGFKTPSRNIYFENGILYSYGSHYPMARKLSAGPGTGYREVILINSNKSSVTTQKHKSQLLSSVKPDQFVFQVPDIKNPKYQDNQTHLMNGIVNTIENVIRGRRYYDISDVDCEINYFNQYADTFLLKRFELDPDFYTLLGTISDENSARDELREKKRAEKFELKRKENIEKWASEVSLWYTCKNTKSIPSEYFGLNYDPVRVNGNRVQTPRGVEVSLREAQAFARALQFGRIKIGDKISEFMVAMIDTNFIEIGCHRINIEQALNAVLNYSSHSLETTQNAIPINSN